MVDYEMMGQAGVGLYENTRNCMNDVEKFFGVKPTRDHLYFFLKGVESFTGKDLKLRRDMSRDELCLKFANSREQSTIDTMSNAFEDLDI